MSAEEFAKRLRNAYQSAAGASFSPKDEALFFKYLQEMIPPEQLKKPALRRDAARILHIFLLQVLKLPDEDWGKPAQFKDIYDCRICANAIAQVCARGLMQPVNRREFGGLLPLSDDEAAAICERICEL
ncbi:MAG: hypothetical protein IK115_04960 [Lachnospiraceae bacterium]|nr:hypothetical protein [Lachnospiraceae bacterium]